MAGVFDKFQKEENDKMIMLGMKIGHMHALGKSIEEIAKETNLSEQLIEEVIRESEQ